jgi:hypothetical protein
VFVFEVRRKNQFDERIAEKELLILAVIEAEAHGGWRRDCDESLVTEIEAGK